MQDTLQSSAFRDFYLDHHRWLQGWLNRKLGSRADAADLSQDTFVNVWSSSAQQPVQKISAPRAYLATIARRVLINFQRRRCLEEAYLDALSLLPEAATLGTEDRLVLLQTLEQIDTVLAGLPDKARQAFLLSQLDGLAYAEIATRLHVSERTIKRYMVQAMTQCLTCMG